ncbi:DMT family transporter [Sphingomonas ginkgonis]|uniref:DMT family transporter n=2 Tax=Sphingomonas ginkgonis TaxID=2315330 RepID=A0A3S0EMW7_9SPHN|nr:DMT family transporter [Sphingomonas ginkgonis]
MPAIVIMLLAFLGGGLLATQAPTNAILARAGGSPVLAALVSFAVGGAALLAVWLVTGDRGGLANLRGVPWYAWLGGFYGALFVGVAAYAAPRIGLASLITIGIAGQVIMALLLDHLGALGLPRVPVSAMRVVGALLVLGGVVLVRRG